MNKHRKDLNINEGSRFKMRNVSIFILVLLLLPLISSTQTFKQNEPIDLKIQCIINGTYCSAAANCNTTILYPNGNLLVNNKAMTNQISFHNYTLPSSSTLGSYFCSVTCCNNSLCGTGTDCDFKITPTGDTGMLGFYIMLTLIILGILIFGVATRNIPITLIGGMITMGWGIYIGFNGFDIFKNTATELLSIGIIAIGAIWIAIARLEYLEIL